MIFGFPPIYDENSKLLILGSMPSVKSLDASFYYMHPRNRFWKVMEVVLGCPVPADPDGRKVLLLQRGVGLWDVLAACERERSLDSAIKNAKPNPIDLLPRISEIPIFVNGGAAERYFKRFFPALTATRLPSTSPANAGGFSWEPWLDLKNYLK